MLGMKDIVLPGNPQGKLAFLNRFGLQIQNWNNFTYLPEVNGSKNLSVFLLLGLTLCVTLLPNTQQIVEKIKLTWWWAIAIGIVTSLSLLSLNRVSEFLYFQF